MRIDLQAAIKTAEELLTELRRLDGLEPDDAPTRAARRQKWRIDKDLRYAAHLGERAGAQVRDAYWAYKREADWGDAEDKDE
jgi:hypothetical protein